MINFPNISPVAFAVGPVEIRYYGLAYAFSAILGFFIIKYVNKKTQQIPSNIANKFIDDLLTYVIIGVLLGGRLGYVMFYNFTYYAFNPLKIFAIWQGGMSFHGALIGVLTAIYLLSKKNNIKFFTVIDLMALVTPIGLFFGRISNFINAELYGKPTTVAWAVKFPNVEFARHPSQLYEATLEGLIIFLVILALYGFKKYKYTGLATGTAITLYGVFRIFVEFFREGEIYFFNTISMGQVLSVPMVILGVAILIYTKKSYNKINHASKPTK